MSIWLARSSTVSKVVYPLLALVFAATQIRSQDVDSFWKKTRAKLAREPMDAQVEQINEPLPFKKFQITLRSLDGVRFRAFMSLPVQGEAPAKPWPVIITTCGYGGRQQGVMLSECQRGYAIIQVFPRGQGESAELWKLDGDKLTSHLDSPEKNYYCGALAELMRAIDFAESRNDLDKNRIALVATSQGGGMSLAVGALDSRVKAVVAHLPFLCNFPLASCTNSLVKRLLGKSGHNDEAALRVLGYFDPLQLAPRLHVPVLMSAGGKDETCPSPTIESVFQRLPGTQKTLKVYPNLAHTSCVDFYNLSWTWLEQNFLTRAP
jgi:cephalosporin-C deacetylase